MQDYNLILDTDSYKLSHFQGYPPGAEVVYSYIESRGGHYPKTVFFGLQPLLAKLARGVTEADFVEAKAFTEAHGLPFNEEGWRIILDEHEGRLPVRIKAVDEGLLIATRTPLLTIENTDPRLPWLVSYLETMLLRDLWYSCTVASRIFFMKRGLKGIFDKTSENGISPFAVLDFSSRGTAGLDASQIGGAAYLTCFMGSDNVPAIRFANHHYNEPMAGFSVPATEHSIMCAYGPQDGVDKPETFRHLLASMGRRGGILSVVSDTWDIFRAVDIWCSMADEIKAAGVTLVIRPDSGTMESVLHAILPKIKAAFGGTVNAKGFMVLDSVKVLWGDGINETTYKGPFEIAAAHGISADSIMVGSGGGLMQVGINRDTNKWAMKASAMRINGEWVDIRKDPITDPGKNSKAGRFAVTRTFDEAGTVGIFETINIDDDDFVPDDMLGAVFEDGEITDETTLAQVRERIEAQL